MVWSPIRMGGPLNKGGLMLARRRGRRANIKPPLAQEAPRFDPE